jgi:hypothetical protein
MGDIMKIANKKRMVERLILSFVMMLMLVACDGPKNKLGNEQKNKKKPAALIVFVQSDLKLNNESDYRIFQSIRDKKIEEVVKKNRDVCPEITSVVICPLCADTDKNGELEEVQLQDSDTNYEKDKKIEHFLLVTKNKYRKFLDNYVGNTSQDIVGAYYYLKGRQDKYREYGEIRVVFISNMIHYLATADDYDLNTEFITFRAIDCLEAFRNQVNEGKIKTKYGAVELNKLFDGKDFIVWSTKPDLDGARGDDGQTRGFDIDGLWRDFFTKIGATEVRMNM